MSRCGSCGTVSGMFDAGDDFVDGGEEEEKKVQMCTFVVQIHFFFCKTLHNKRYY